MGLDERRKALVIRAAKELVLNEMRLDEALDLIVGAELDRALSRAGIDVRSVNPISQTALAASIVLSMFLACSDSAATPPEAVFLFLFLSDSREEVPYFS